MRGSSPRKTIFVGSPALPAGVSDTLWQVGAIVDLIAAGEALEDGSLLVGEFANGA
jgi:hypothetical protein